MSPRQATDSFRLSPRDVLSYLQSMREEARSERRETLSTITQGDERILKTLTEMDGERRRAADQAHQSLRDEIGEVRQKVDELVIPEDVSEQVAELKFTVVGDGNGHPGLVRRMDKLEASISSIHDKLTEMNTNFIRTLQWVIIPLVLTLTVGVGTIIWKMITGEIVLIKP